MVEKLEKVIGVKLLETNLFETEETKKFLMTFVAQELLDATPRFRHLGAQPGPLISLLA